MSVKNVRTQILPVDIDPLLKAWELSKDQLQKLKIKFIVKESDSLLTGMSLSYTVIYEYKSIICFV